MDYGEPGVGLPTKPGGTWEEPERIGRNLGMDFGFFFQLRTLDVEGSKKALETSFLDS